jgi:hypothetical protein
MTLRWRDDGRIGVGREREVIEMSLRPRLPGEVPAQTAEVARLAFPKGCVCIRIREALGPLFADEDFVGAVPTTCSTRLAATSVGARVGAAVRGGPVGLQAAAAMRWRIDWKFLLGPGVNRSWVRPFRAERVPRPSGGSRPGAAAPAGAGPGAVARTRSRTTRAADGTPPTVPGSRPRLAGRRHQRPQPPRHAAFTRHTRSRRMPHRAPNHWGNHAPHRDHTRHRPSAHHGRRQLLNGRGCRLQERADQDRRFHRSEAAREAGADLQRQAISRRRQGRRVDERLPATLEQCLRPLRRRHHGRCP